MTDEIKPGFAHIFCSIPQMKVGETQNFIFPYSGITIKSMVPSCQCGVPTDDKNNSKIVVKFTAKDIPLHLKQRGILTVAKRTSLMVKYVVDSDPDPKVVREASLEMYTLINGKP